MNQGGEILLVWTENTSWGKGGVALWQLFDTNGKAISEQKRANDLPAWSFATAVAETNGNFVVVY
jgi:hypothetical protein